LEDLQEQITNFNDRIGEHAMPGRDSSLLESQPVSGNTSFAQGTRIKRNSLDTNNRPQYEEQEQHNTSAMDDQNNSMNQFEQDQYEENE
jgi:hypothetical protein